MIKSAFFNLSLLSNKIIVVKKCKKNCVEKKSNIATAWSLSAIIKLISYHRNNAVACRKKVKPKKSMRSLVFLARSRSNIFLPKNVIDKDRKNCRKGQPFGGGQGFHSAQLFFGPPPKTLFLL